ncbi:unnamed protein product [marine sediment metagenome]|uniref:Response regulatory domain-containing protein n=1 Tax=marine sediment metagenome TaxID=412755 RepID=X0TZ40_9ZZZZ
MKRRILFVDDEPRVLDGLRRTLRAERDRWDMSFVDGADAALGVIHDEVGRHFDPAAHGAFEESIKELQAIRTELRDEASCLAGMGCTL